MWRSCRRLLRKKLDVQTTSLCLVMALLPSYLSGRPVVSKGSPVYRRLTPCIVVTHWVQHPPPARRLSWGRLLIHLIHVIALSATEEDKTDTMSSDIDWDSNPRTSVNWDARITYRATGGQCIS